MKKYPLLAIVVIATLFLALPGVTRACTYFFLKAKDGSIVSARSMEFYSDLGAQLQMIPRGTTYVQLRHGTASLTMVTCAFITGPTPTRISA